MTHADQVSNSDFSSLCETIIEVPKQSENDTLNNECSTLNSECSSLKGDSTGNPKNESSGILPVEGIFPSSGDLSRINRQDGNDPSNDCKPVSLDFAHNGLGVRNNYAEFSSRNSPQVFTSRNSPQAFTSRNSPQAFTSRNSPQAFTARNSPQAFTARNSPQVLKSNAFNAVTKTSVRNEDERVSPDSSNVDCEGYPAGVLNGHMGHLFGEHSQHNLLGSPYHANHPYFQQEQWLWDQHRHSSQVGLCYYFVRLYWHKFYKVE